jgi:hypothetical protein
MVPNGATVKATTVGQFVRTTALATFVCTGSTMHGTVVSNSGTQLEIEFTSVTFGDCTGFQNEPVEAKNLPWCWKASSKMTADTFELRGGGCKEAEKALTMVTGGCPYTRFTPMSGKFTTSPEDFKMTFSEQEFVSETGGVCITAFKLDAQYTVETAASPFTSLLVS